MPEDQAPEEVKILTRGVALLIAAISSIGHHMPSEVTIERYEKFIRTGKWD